MDNFLKLGEAAALAKVSPSTITRDVKGGKITCAKDEKGKRIFDPAELSRVYGVKVEDIETLHGRTSAEKPPRHSMTEHAMALHEAEKAALQAEIDGLKERLRDKEKSLDDARAERDEWREESKKQRETVQQQTRLLEHHTEKEEKPPGFFARIFAK